MLTIPTFGLVGMGDELPICLDELAHQLNRHQKSFKFKKLGSVSSITIGSPDVYWKWFDIARLCKLLSHWYAGDAHYLIGVTESPLTHIEELAQYPDLELDYFSRGDFHKSAILTVHRNVLKHRARGSNIYQYVGFLAMCEAIILLSKEDLNHDNTSRCAFYECADREQFAVCMELAQICGPCKSKLLKAGINEAYIKDFQKVLKWCSQPSWQHIFRVTINDPLVALVLGAGIGWLISVFLGREYCWWVVVFLLGFGIAALSIKRKRNKIIENE